MCKKSKKKTIAEPIDAYKVASTFISPVSDAARIISIFNQSSKLDAAALADKIYTRLEQIQTGDTRAIEAILFSQATALEAIFTKAATYTACAQTVSALQVWSSIALKAQNQSRKTLATLIELKNPTKATFIRQQNNAINQQVNNHEINSEKNKKCENELLRGKQHAALEEGGAHQTSAINTAMATVEAIYRSQDSTGKGQK